MFSSSNTFSPSVMDGSSIGQNPQQEELPTQGASCTMTQSMMRDTGLLHPHKRPRMDMRQGNHQQQVVQQMLQSNQIPHLPAMMQQQRPPKQIPQQTPRSCPTSESGLCARRLMLYMYDLRNRPENSITYWRKFVEEYFAPKAKKRWCLSFYTTSANDSVGDFPQASTDEWQCGICGSKPGKGFQASYEVLPMVNQVNFANGVIDELLYLEMPREGKLLSGMMVLEYANAVQQSVHEQFRVVRKGHLRIIFTTDLKILSWEFCARSHEELSPRRMLVDQLDKLLKAAKNYEDSVNESGSSVVPVQDMQAFCNMFVEAGCQMARDVHLIRNNPNPGQSLIHFGAPFSGVNHIQPVAFQCNDPSSVAGQAFHDMPIKNQQQTSYGNQPLPENNDTPSQENQQFLQEMVNKGASHQSYTALIAEDNVQPEMVGGVGSSAAMPKDSGQVLNVSGNIQGENNDPSSVAGQAFHDMPIQNQQRTSYGNQPLPENNDTPSQENQQFLQEKMNKGSPRKSYSALIAEDNVQPEMVGDVGSSAAMAKDSGQVLNVSGNIQGEILPGEIERVMPSTDASKQDATKNNCFSSSKSDDEEQDLLEQFNLEDLDIFQEFLDGI